MEIKPKDWFYQPQFFLVCIENIKVCSCFCSCLCWKTRAAQFTYFFFFVLCSMFSASLSESEELPHLLLSHSAEMYICTHKHREMSLQLFENVLSLSSLSDSICSRGLDNPSPRSSRGCRVLWGCPTPASLPCWLCCGSCFIICFSPVKWGRWHFVFTAQSAQHCALFFLSFLKSKSNFKKLLVAQAVLLAALLLFGQE